MLKILVTYAVQGEFVELKWPDIEPYYVRTGIGKVKSAFHLAEAIRQVQPDSFIFCISRSTNFRHTKISPT